MKTRPDLPISRLNVSNKKNSKENEIPLSEILNSASTTCSIKKKKWRRERKNTLQVKVLIQEYNRSSLWTKEQVMMLAEQTGLTEAQVYKWGWDYKKKLRRQMGQCSGKELECFEILPLSKIDLEMLEVQRNYKEFMASMNSIMPMHLVF